MWELCLQSSVLYVLIKLTGGIENKGGDMKLLNDFGVRAMFGLLAFIGLIFTTSYCLIAKVPAEIFAIAIGSYNTIVTAIVAFYFGQKNGQNGADKDKDIKF